MFIAKVLAAIFIWAILSWIILYPCKWIACMIDGHPLSFRNKYGDYTCLCGEPPKRR